MLKPFIANIINSVALILFGLWGYLSSDTPSITALIPVIFGVLLIAMSSGVKKENKVIAHIAVTLTLLILFGLIKPLTGALDKGNTIAIFRVTVMIITTLSALVSFIMSFIAARKARELKTLSLIHI